MYILQTDDGDWIITTTTDKTGKRFGLKQLSNFKHLVDEEKEWKNLTGEIAGITVLGKWACETENNTKYDFKANEKPRKSSQKNVSECLQECESSNGCVALTYFKKGGTCMLFRKIYNNSYEAGGQTVKIDCSRNGTSDSGVEIDVHKQNSDKFVVVSVICGLLVVCCALVAVFMFAQKRKSALREQESIDLNPDYGDHEEDCNDDQTQVVDRNDNYVL